MRVLVFGDSIAQGFWDTEGGWAQRLRSYYDKKALQHLGKKYAGFFNLAVDGDTTAGVLKHFENETRTREWPGEEFIFVFAIGTNDTIFRGQEFDSTPEKYRQQLNELLKVAHNYSGKILFVGLTPVVDERVQPMAWSSSGKCYSNERVWLFEQTLREFCRQNNLPCVAIYERYKEAQQSKELMPDGTHPNNEGHELICRLVKPELDKLLNS